VGRWSRFLSGQHPAAVRHIMLELARYAAGAVNQSTLVISSPTVADWPTWR
jgi:hypothetical protein